MKKKNPFEKYIPVWLGLAASLALAGCVEGEGYYGGYPVAGGSYVEITSDSDFYGPLSPYGSWETIDGYGTCWVPSGVGPDWEPYEDGSWISTDGGWYWESDEPWGWATYHYGRWFDDPGIGWCWIPGTQWAPAWVSWCDEDDYVGWAPLPPESGGSWGGFFGARRATVAPRDYVFVPRRQFLEPIRPAEAARFRARAVGPGTFAANLQVSRRGPAVAVVEQASGRTVQPRPLSEVRRRREARIVSNRHWNEVRSVPTPAPPRPENRTYRAPAARPEVMSPALAPRPNRVERVRPTPPRPIHAEPTPARTVRREESPAPRAHVPAQPERRVEPMAPPAEARRAQPPPHEEKRPPPRKEKREDER